MNTKPLIITIATALATTVLAACATHSRQSASSAEAWTPATLAKLDIPARMLADSLATGQKTSARTIAVMVSLTDGAKASSIADAGFNLRTDLGTMAVVSVSTDSLSRLAALPQIKSVALGTPQSATDPTPETQQIKSAGKTGKTQIIKIQ
ncbi:MAG TPA: hypothetical protein DCE24_01375 [Porphyromonadaceae bacterium]|jgi:hypothetical protein|nr:hypothetical protein [Paramuribaculum sp.]HAB40483.1 hypothetical protein [Porphyromonadaceae bacterium]